MYKQPEKLKNLLQGELNGIIFDCDGVLLNSGRSNSMYYNLVRSYFDLPKLNAEQEHYVHMHPSMESFHYILPPQFLPLLGEAIAHIDYMRDLVPYIEPESGIYSLLIAMRDAKVNLAVHTNRTTLAEAVLKHFKLDEYFPVVVTAATHAPKPDPEGVHAILAAWDVPAKSVLFVGDSQLDEKAATAAGVGFVAYKNPNLNANFFVDDFSAFQALLLSA